MAEIRALKFGLLTQLDNGAKVFGVLSEDRTKTCFEMTAPDGKETRFALSHEALVAMVDITNMLLERDGEESTPEADRSEQGRNRSAVLGNTMQALTEGGVPFLQALDATLKAFDHPADVSGVPGLDGSRTQEGRGE